MYLRSIKKNTPNISLDESIDTDKDGNPLTLMDIMADDEDIIDQLSLKINSEKLYRYIEQLPERERTIIVLRYGLNGEEPLTQKEVAALLKISRSYVSRIEKKTIGELSCRFKNNK